jgi:hypothetical protein
VKGASIVRYSKVQHSSSHFRKINIFNMYQRRKPSQACLAVISVADVCDCESGSTGRVRLLRTM